MRIQRSVCCDLLAVPEAATTPGVPVHTYIDISLGMVFVTDWCRSGLVGAADRPQETLYS